MAASEFDIKVTFYSYFKDITGCPNVTVTLACGSRIQELLAKLYEQFPKLSAMKNSTLVAVGVEYQGKDYVLKPGDEVSLFPPVQGG